MFNTNFEFIAPEFILQEINKYKTVFVKKAGLSVEEYDLLLSLIFDKVKIISQEEYAVQLSELFLMISDPKDIPYLACCIATHSQGIWSHDPHLKEQENIKIFTNIDLLRM